ncbi:MAG: alpha-isopropylmalate synthase regulatory domain-containing protein [bacterium]
MSRQANPYEPLDANLELNVLRSIGGYRPPFRIVRNYHLVDDGAEPEATIVLEACGRVVHEADTGVGPIDALANALKKALTPAFPFIDEVRLVDFAARIHESHSGTRAAVEVSILQSDGREVWRVSQLSRNINEASLHALADGYEFAIARRRAHLARAARSVSRRKTERARRKGGGGKGASQGRKANS